MTVAKRKRTVPLLFYVSEEERGMIQAKMELYGTTNLSAYLRKMAIDGFVVNLEDLRQGQERLWDAAQKILTSLAKIQ